MEATHSLLADAPPASQPRHALNTSIDTREDSKDVMSRTCIRQGLCWLLLLSIYFIMHTQ